MSFNDERGAPTGSDQPPDLVMPGEHEEVIDPSELAREGLDVEEGDMTPEEAMAQGHPTPGHITGRTTP